MGELIVKKGCFAYNSNTKECNALTIIDCNRCNFYKTKAQVRRERKKALARILSLDEDMSDYLIDKYYSEKVGCGL